MANTRTSVTLYVYVKDVDELCKRARIAGATIIQPPQNEHWGDRCCLLLDPEGHSWMFATHIEGVLEEP